MHQFTPRVETLGVMLPRKFLLSFSEGSDRDVEIRETIQSKVPAYGLLPLFTANSMTYCVIIA